MKPENKLFIETNRHHLEAINKLGTVKNLQLQHMRQVMIGEFNPHYGSMSETDADQVFQLVRDLFRHYDKWHKTT